jgi:DNA recombination protein RmuC
MNTFLIAFGFIILIGLVVYLLLNLKQLSEKMKIPDQSQAFVLLQNQVNALNQTLENRLSDSNKLLQSQYGQSAKLIQNVTEKLVRFEETNKQVLNFQDQLKSLQDILKNPKQRGVVGEYFLETVLQNVLPPKSYQMQYKFNDGSIVDAVVFVKDKIIPVDSKFSLENYERILAATDSTEKERLEKLFKQDLKNRIDETSKYIKPGENTMDFSFMFIPSEAIYYDLLINKVGAVTISTQDLIEYAFKEKHVIIVSPTSFLAYLQTVLQGLRAMQIEESAKEIRKNVEVLQKHLLNYELYVQKIGSQLSTVVNTYNTSANEFKKINKDVVKITGVGEVNDIETVNKPALED